jgi:hypothetical protein
MDVVFDDIFLPRACMAGMRAFSEENGGEPFLSVNLSQFRRHSP